MAANLSRPSTDENISTTLSSGITDVASSMDVSDASKIVAPCYLVIDRVDSAGTLKATSLWEYVKVTNVAGNTLTITRAQGGSTGQAHSSGAVVEAVVTSSMFEDWYTALNPEHTASGGHVIVGTMTVAGMNLASVATIASAGIGDLRITSSLSASGASIVGVFPSGASGAILQSNGALAPSFIPSTGVVRFQSIATSLVSIGSASYVDFMATSLPNTFSTGFGKVTFHADLSPSASLTSDWQILVNNVQVYYTQMVWPSESGFFRPWTMTFGTTLASGATITVQAKTNSGSVSHNNGAYRLILAEL